MAFDAFDFKIGDRVRVSKTATVVGVHVSNRAGGGEDTLTVEDETGYRNTVYQHADVELPLNPGLPAGTLFRVETDLVVRQSIGDKGYRWVTDEIGDLVHVPGDLVFPWSCVDGYDLEVIA